MVRVPAGLLQPVLEPVEPHLVVVAQALDHVRRVAVLAQLVEPLERGVREAHARLHLLAVPLGVLPEPERLDQRRQRQAGHDERDARPP